MRYLIGLNLLLLLLQVPVPAAAVTAQGYGEAARPAVTSFSSYDSAIEFYRQLAESHDWPPVAATPVLRIGDHHPALADIRQRLVLLGDMTYFEPAQDPEAFDETLRQALEHFQRRHGLAPDGVWGPHSRAALEVPPDERVRQLLLNRYRQQQFRERRTANGRYVQVNIPAYEMRYFEEGREVLRMRAIVGKLEAKTPLVESRISSLELNPDWNVPSGIAYRDLLPKLEVSPDYLSQSSLLLVEGYGDSMRELPLPELDYDRLYRGPQPQQRFWQAPGPENPLGQMKFNFPNDYLVYMHGTPSANLFERPVRNFSSGCIRIEYPERLARRLFGDAGLTAEGTWRFEDIIASGENRVLNFPEPVPVYTTYWTAWLDDRHQVQFRDDIYRRDRADLATLPPRALALP